MTPSRDEWRHVHISDAKLLKLASGIGAACIQIRDRKHVVGESVASIEVDYPTAPCGWVADIAFYRRYPLADMSRRLAHWIFMLRRESTSDLLIDARSLGIDMNEREVISLRERTQVGGAVRGKWFVTDQESNSGWD